MKLWPTLLLLPFLSSCSSRAPENLPPVDVTGVSRELAPGIIMEIDPRLELLSGVQAWTAWTSPGGPAAVKPGEVHYFDELKEFLAPLRADPAMALAEQLEKRQGFAYDAPPNLVMATEGGLAFRTPAGGFSDYLRQRAGGEKNLAELCQALANIASRSDFPAFFERKRPYYQTILEQASSGLDAPGLSAWLDGYYGNPGRVVFHYLLAPGQTMPGGYGITLIRNENGQTTSHVYQVVRRAGELRGSQLAGLTLHEFGHSFVNPAIGEQVPAHLRPQLEKLFAPVRDRMRAMAYGNLETFLNELVLRATSIQGMMDLGMISRSNGELLSEANRGFWCIQTVFTLLVEYQADRARYPDFQSFGPVLLERLAAEADNLVAKEYPAFRS